MKKSKLILGASVFLASIGITLSTSCSRNDEPLYTALLPEKVDALLSVNVESLLEKSQLWDNSQVQALLDEATGEMPGTQQIMRFLLKNPEISGIDFHQNVYMYAPQEAEDYAACGIFAMKDARRLQTLLEQSGLFDKFEESDGYVWAEHPDGLLVFDDAKGAFFVSDQTVAKESVLPLLQQPASESFSATELFQSLPSGDDAGMLVPMSVAEDSDMPALLPVSDADQIPLDKLYVYAGLDFEENSMGIQWSCLPMDSETKGWMESLYEGVGTATGGLLPSLDGSAMAFVSWNMDGGLLADRIEREVPMRNEEEMDEWLPVFEAIDGDCLLSVAWTHFLPQIVFKAEAPDARSLDALHESLGGKAVGSNRYLLQQEMFPLYYGWEDGCLWASLSESLPTAERGKTLMDKYPWAESAEGAYFYMGLDAKVLQGLMAADLLSNILSGNAVPQQDLELVLDVLQRLGISYVELFSNELGRYRLIVHTDSDNPLALLVDYLMEEQAA